LLGELCAGTAILAGVVAGRGTIRERAVADHIGYRRLASGFLTIAQHLRKKSPDGDRDGVDAMPAEQAAVLGKDALDAFCREHIGKGQPRAGQECIRYLLKTAAALVAR